MSCKSMTSGEALYFIQKQNGSPHSEIVQLSLLTNVHQNLGLNVPSTPESPNMSPFQFSGSCSFPINIFNLATDIL